MTHKSGCTNGKDCDYSHPQDCPQFQTNSHKKGDNCELRHGPRTGAAPKGAAATADANAKTKAKLTAKAKASVADANPALEAGTVVSDVQSIECTGFHCAGYAVGAVQV